MPTYEYACSKCGGHFEYFQWVSEDPKSVCEECGGELKRLLSAGTGLIFKGSGFYITDYKGGSGDSGGGEGKSPAKGESKSESKSGSPGGGESKSSDSSGSSSGKGGAKAGKPPKSD